MPQLLQLARLQSNIEWQAVCIFTAAENEPGAIIFVLFFWRLNFSSNNKTILDLDDPKNFLTIQEFIKNF